MEDWLVEKIRQRGYEQHTDKRQQGNAPGELEHPIEACGVGRITCALEIYRGKELYAHGRQHHERIVAQLEQYSVIARISRRIKELQGPPSRRQINP